MRKYNRTIGGQSVDVYDILAAFNVTCPATQHAIKKLLMPGQRGAKSQIEDLQEAMFSVQRAVELASGLPASMQCGTFLDGWDAAMASTLTAEPPAETVAEGYKQLWARQVSAEHYAHLISQSADEDEREKLGAEAMVMFPADCEDCECCGSVRVADLCVNADCSEMAKASMAIPQKSIDAWGSQEIAQYVRARKSRRGE